MGFNPFAVALDVQTSTLETMADATKRASMAPERAAEMENIEVGLTPSEVVYTENKLELLHYESQTDEQNEVPILIIYALINKPYILDLQPDRSVVRHLLEAGHDVYLIDWNEPSRLDQELGLHDYIDRYIDNCVDVVAERSDQETINILGYCMGGTMSAIYAALYPEKVNALGLMAAGLCFEDTGGVLEAWGQEEYYDPSEVTETFGNVPSDFLAVGFDLMDPVDNLVTKYITLYENLENDAFVENFSRMEKWLDEGIDLAGRAYVEFLEQIYQNNELCRNEFELDGTPVDVANIDMPVLQIMGEYDHLIPPSASKPFNEKIGSDDVTTIEYPTGHIGLSVSSSSHENVWPEVADWYHAVSEADYDAGDGEAIGVEDVDGIGPTYAERLKDGGVETVAELVAEDAETIAEIAETTVEKAEGWLDQLE